MKYEYMYYRNIYISKVPKICIVSYDYEFDYRHFYEYRVSSLVKEILIKLKVYEKWKI